jgi:hypothetical protein
MSEERDMKLAVEFPSVSYREGPEAVMRLARAIERIGYDHIDIFDHVIMGVPIEGTAQGPLQPGHAHPGSLHGLAYLAAVTTRVTLGTEVLVLPQRQPALVAKQVSTLDTLSGGTGASRRRAWAGRNRSTRLSAKTSTRGARAWTRRSGSSAPTGAMPR